MTDQFFNEEVLNYKIHNYVYIGPEDTLSGSGWDLLQCRIKASELMFHICLTLFLHTLMKSADCRLWGIVMVKKEIFSQKVTYTGCQPLLLQSSMSRCLKTGSERYRGARYSEWECVVAASNLWYDVNCMIGGTGMGIKRNPSQGSECIILDSIFTGTTLRHYLTVR